MAATPLLLAVGAGAAAGSAFLVMQERQRLQRVAAMRAIDKREQDMLAQPGMQLSSVVQMPVMQRLAEAPPVWVLLVHLGEAQLSERMVGKKAQVTVKYGERGWSLKRETQEVVCKDTRDGQGPSASFNENCIFLLRRGLAPRVRLRFMKRGRTGKRTVAKQDLILNLDRHTPFWQEGLWKLTSFSGKGSELLGSLRIVVEVRPFSLDELCSHGLNVGTVLPRVTLADVVNPGQPELPLLTGEAVAASPEAVRLQQHAQERRQAEERMRALREEAPIAESGSEDGSDADTDDESRYSSDTSSEAESSEEEEGGRRPRRRRGPACPSPFPCR